MIDHHTLEPSTLDALATGHGGAAAVQVLHDAQVSKHILLIRYLLDAWPDAAADRDEIAGTLAAAHDRDPTKITRLLGEPMVGGWAVIASRAQHQGVLNKSDIGQLAALAAVGAAVAGGDADFTVPVRAGQVSVPTIGRATFPSPPEHVRLIASGGGLVVRTDAMDVRVPTEHSGDTDGWAPVHRLEAEAHGHRIRLSLDDLDPYRHGHHAPPAGRLTAADLPIWRERLSGAWRLLTRHLPERAAELSVGLRTLVPLAQPDRRTARSATIRHVFGAFGPTQPTSTADFAVTMVHEFQHSKLSAVLDLVRLHDTDDAALYFAPWRADPRPLDGLLQGVYAFVGVADAWRALRGAEGVDDAELQFAAARLQVDRGLTAVEESESLTPTGTAFAAGLRRSVDAMLAEPVMPSTAREAEAMLERTREAWATRNAVLLGT